MSDFSKDFMQLFSLGAAVFGALWAYVRFVAKPAILADMERRFMSRELYSVQYDYIIKDLADIKAEIKDIKTTLGGIYDKTQKP